MSIRELATLFLCHQFYLNRAAMAEGHREAILVVNMHPLRAVGA